MTYILAFGQPGLNAIVSDSRVGWEDETGKQVEHTAKARKGVPSIFNRYSLFYYNSLESHALSPEGLFDSPDRLSSADPIGAQGLNISSVIKNPSG